MPASRDGLGPFYRDVVAVDPLEPYGARSAAHRLELLAPALPFPVSGARLVPSNNNDVWRLGAGYLRVAWRGDRGRLAREAELLARLRGVIPVPEVLDCGGDERLSWSLTTAMPGTPLDGLCTQPAPDGLRGIVAEAAGLLRALRSWPVPPDLARTLRCPVADRDPASASRARRCWPGSLRTTPGFSPPRTWTGACGGMPSPTPSATSSSGRPTMPRPTAWTRATRCTPCAA